MKYLPQVTSRGPSGAAKVSVVEDNILIQFLDDEGQPTGKKYNFSTTDLPEGMERVESDVYFVSLSSQADKLYGIRPFNGSVVVKFSKLIAKDGQAPAPKRDQGSRTRRDGTTYQIDELKFTAIGVIQAGKYQGMEVVMPFLYNRKGSGFVDDGNGNLAVRGGGAKGEQLVAFLEASGVWGKEMPYTDNVLPMLEARILELDRPFMVVMRGGWPESYGEVPDFGNGHQSKPATKAATKTAKKTTAPGKRKVN